jgi:2-polyprenyl-3-methyl-5-hydroxy-6-metoxy-1,4-benzoquinol methylase
MKSNRWFIHKHGDTMSSVLKTREEIVLPFVKSKDVLDLGGADFDMFIEKRKGSIWLHELLASEAKSILGIDIQKDIVARLKSEGLNFEEGNVEQLNLNKQFEVIVAGEIIEHLFNAGLFLDSVRRHLKKDGVFIISTPNAFCIRNTSMILQRLKKGNARTRFDHTCWYCMQTLSQLLIAQGFEILEKHFCTYTSSTPGRKFMRDILFSINREWAEQLVFICKVK